MSWITDQDAPHFNIPDEYVLADQKATPVDADRVLIEDSADGFTKKYADVGDLPGGGGGSVDVEDDDVFVAAADTLNFGTNLTVTDDGGGKVTVDASGGGGGNAAYAETIGDNTNTTYTVTHNLGTTDLVVQLWDLTGTDPVEATGDASSIEAISVNAIDVTFAAAPPVDSYRVVILADGGSSGGGDTFATQLLHVRDEKAVSVPGGGFTSGAWRTRTLNTVKTNEITGASLATDQITLPAGDYYTEWEAPALGVARHQSKLHDTTGTVDLVVGSSMLTAAADTVQTASLGRGRFTLGVESVLEVQHRCETTRAVNGFGEDSNFTTEVYTDIRIWKLP